MSSFLRFKSESNIVDNGNEPDHDEADSDGTGTWKLLDQAGLTATSPWC